MAEDDFLKFFSDTLASVSGISQEPKPAEPKPVAAPAAAPARVPVKGKMVYVGFDDATRNVFQQNLADKLPFVETADLQEIKSMIVKNEIALIVFDGTSFIKPGIPITRFIKEKALPIKVAHVFAPQRVTEEYEKYRQYHLHLQPDYQEFTDEIFAVIDKIRKDFGI
jgi:hypothetical protein